MKNFSLISKLSIWVVNIMMVLLVFGGLFSFYMLARLSGPGNRPASTEGMTEWRYAESVNFGSYFLTRVTKYDGNDFSDEIELRMPYPKISPMDIEEYQGKFEIVNESGIAAEAYLSTHESPIIYRLTGQKEKGRAAWLFVIMITLSLGLAFFILITLRNFLISMSRGIFFSRENYRRLIILSVPALVYPILSYCGGLLSRNFFYDHFRVLNGRVLYTVNVSFAPMIFGIVFLLMAAMVYEGTKLKEEQDLTI